MANVGLACGGSTRLVVLDVDPRNGGEESLRRLLNGHELPPTLIANTGGGGKHFYFTNSGPKLKNGPLKGFPGLDLKADGGYVLIPPSITDRPYTWDGCDPDLTVIAEVPAWLHEKLAPRKQVRRSHSSASGKLQIRANGASAYAETALRNERERVASAARGTRNNTLNRAAFSLGQLVGGGVLSRDCVESELLEAADVSGLLADDGEVAVRATIRSGLEAGERDPRSMPEPDVKSESASRVFEVAGQQIALADEALEALAANPDSGVYVRGDFLARVVRDRGRPRPGIRRQVGSPFIEPLTHDALRDRIARLGAWRRVSKQTASEMMPPDWMIRNLMARALWPLPTLEGVIGAPTLRPDGSILRDPGFDEATGLLHLPSGEFPPIPDSPTADDVARALETLKDPLVDFPFRAESDGSAAIATILSIVARPAIDGCVPTSVIRGTTPGIGKGLLADAIGIASTGRAPSRMALASSKEEMDKRILSVAIAGDPLVLLDNLEGRIGSTVLSAAITARSWQGRVLGLSKMGKAPLNAVWIGTGNNVLFRGDFGRRVVPIDMVSSLEHPEDRKTEEFKHPRLLEYVARVRPQIVVAALTILRAYHLAGRPAHREPCKGSFEAWDELVRGALIWAGLADPDAGRERVRRESDMDLAALDTALIALAQEFGNTPFTAAQAVGKAGEQGELHDALLGLLSDRAKLDGKSLGYAFRGVRNRVVSGKRLVSPDEKRSGNRWGVEQIADVPVRGDAEIRGDDSSLF